MSEYAAALHMHDCVHACGNQDALEISTPPNQQPSIAQLVERRTVEGTKRETSLGRWFKSLSRAFTNHSRGPGAHAVNKNCFES